MIRRTIILLLCLAALLGVTSAAPVVAQDVPAGSLPPAGYGQDLEPAVDIAAPSEAAAPNVQGIVLAFNPSGPGRCEVNISPWPADAKAAVTRAAAIWSSLLNGSQPIVIDVCWSPDFAANGLLANCGSRTGTFANFAGAPLANTNYPLPLANQLSSSDLNGGDPEMQCRFNANRLDWYTGLDGIVPTDRFDLLSTALHEIGHGLGFAGGVGWDDGSGSAECTGTRGVGCYSTTPDVYDRFVQTSNGTSILSLANNSMALGNALTGDALSRPAIHEGDLPCSPSRGRPVHCRTASTRSRIPRPICSSEPTVDGSLRLSTRAGSARSNVNPPTATRPTSQPIRNAGPEIRPRAENSKTRTAMI